MRNWMCCLPEGLYWKNLSFHEVGIAVWMICRLVVTSTGVCCFCRESFERLIAADNTSGRWPKMMSIPQMELWTSITILQTKGQLGNGRLAVLFLV